MKTYEITEELGCKDGEVRICAYLVTTRENGRYVWDERFSTMEEAKAWVSAMA